MNIVVIGKNHVESFALHISETLINMGHNSIIFDPGLQIKLNHNNLSFKIAQAKTQLYNIYKQTNWGKSFEKRKIDYFFKDCEVDLVICCHDFLTPFQVDHIKKTKNCKIVLWFPDAISNFGKAMFLDSDYDVLFFKEPFVVDILKNEYNKNVFYLPECCNPLYHKKIDLNYEEIIKYKCDITTAGNLHTARSSFFKKLNDYDVKIWGNPPPTWIDITSIKNMLQYSFVSNEKKSKVFRASKIVLNTFHPTEVYGVNVRLFEVAATSSFQICNYRKSIETLYSIDEEIVIYNSFSELKEKINYYLDRPDLREKISNKAYKRTIEEHTYFNRLSKLIKITFNCL